MPAVDPIATWSNTGTAGNIGTIARFGKKFETDAVIQADYLICNDTKYTCSTQNGAEVCDYRDNVLNLWTPGGGPGAVQLAPYKEGNAKQCGCIYRPPNVMFQVGNSVTKTLVGTYQAFKPGNGCRKNPIKLVSAGALQPILCTKVDRMPTLPGLHADWQCDLSPLLQKKKRNARLCTKGAESFVSETGVPFGKFFYAVVDGKLVRQSINPEGQTRPEYSILTKGCTDFYEIDELIVVLAGDGESKPNKVFLKNAELSFIKP